MSITCLPSDPISQEILTWYEGGPAVLPHAEVPATIPISSCFDELLGLSVQNPHWATFEAPSGRPSFNLFNLKLCPHVDWEACLTHPSEALMKLYLFIQEADKDLAYILAKMTLRKA